MRFLHSHHPSWPVVAPLLVTQPVPHFIRILLFPALVSMIVPAVALHLFVSIPSGYPLIEILLLRACPSNRGLPIVVIPPVLFPCCGSYDHDDSPFIPVWVLALVLLRSCYIYLCTCTLEWRVDSGPSHSLMPYIIRCMHFDFCTFPCAFPTTLSVKRVLLSYPCLLFMLILHGNWWLSV